MIESDPELDARYGKAKSMAIGGGIAMGVGFIMSMTVGMSLAARSMHHPVTGSALTYDYTIMAQWIMFGVGLSALTAGAVVLGIGLSKRKAVLQEAQGRLGAHAFVSPWFGKRSGGIGLTLRY